jgi:DNA-directed RNA polymerase subunit RPC12/RpoP
MPVRFGGPKMECSPLQRSPRLRLSAALLLLWVLGLPISGMAQPDAPRPDARQGEGLRDQFVLDFRGQPRPANMVLFGPQADGFIKPEAEGLRITLPKDRTSVKPVGLSLALAVGGDFEITAAFEVLKAEEPPPGRPSYGVGVLLSVNQAARVGRLARALGQQVVSWDHWATVDGKPKFLLGASPGEGQRGRLRLKRDKTTLHFLWSPDLVGDTFEEVHRCEFEAEEISQLWFELSSDWGGENGALDVRLLELQVRASRPAADPVVASEEKPATGPRGWWGAAAIAALAILLVLAAVLFVGYRRRGTPPPSANAMAGQAAESPSGAQAVAFACADCGKRLKSNAEMAGKKIKCPQCGSVAVVPRS